MSLKIESVMTILDFLNYKHARKGVEFDVLIESCEPNGRGVDLESSVIISEDISRGSFILTFMDDLVRKYVGGYVQMDFAYLKNLSFDGSCLHFETSNDYSISLR